jgi:hypothetical protein
MKRKRRGTAKETSRRARISGRTDGHRPGSEPLTTRSRRKRADLLSRITPHEAVAILRVLLERHSELHGEAEEVAKAMVTDVQVEDVAEAVEQAVLGLDLDDLNARAGRHSWGYVEPSEAAWELLEDELNPFLDDMKRHIELGFERAAVTTCQGIVLGLYRGRGKTTDGVLGWAEDFPAEMAAQAAAMLARESSAKRGRGWRLSESFIAQVPDWGEMLDRATRKGTGRRPT